MFVVTGSMELLVEVPILSTTMQNFMCPPSDMKFPYECINIDNGSEVDGHKNLFVSEKCVDVDGGNRFLPLWNVAADISSVHPSIASHSDMNLCYDPLVDVPIARVTQNYEVWKHNLLGGDDDLFVLNGILNGFSIVDLNCTLPRFATKITSPLRTEIN